MAFTLEEFSAEAHRILAADPGPEGRKKICELVSRASTDPEFVAKYLPDDGPERKILYEDPELGFCILGHVNQGAKASQPHDHGPTWAIYGQAEGETIMTDWAKVDAGQRDRARQGAPCPRLQADPRRGLCLQRGRSALAAARRLDQADPHRRPQRREDPPLSLRAGRLASRRPDQVRSAAAGSPGRIPGAGPGGDRMTTGACVFASRLSAPAPSLRLALRRRAGGRTG